MRSCCILLEEDLNEEIQKLRSLLKKAKPWVNSVRTTISLSENDEIKELDSWLEEVTSEEFF
jgi:hypothetical protein